jgi:hypothetical protein
MLDVSLTLDCGGNPVVKLEPDKTIELVAFAEG